MEIYKSDPQQATKLTLKTLFEEGIFASVVDEKNTEDGQIFLRKRQKGLGLSLDLFDTKKDWDSFINEITTTINHSSFNETAKSQLLQSSADNDDPTYYKP